MEQLIELLQQIQDLAGVAIDALNEAAGAAGGAAGGGEAGPPVEGELPPEGAKGGPPPEEDFPEG